MLCIIDEANEERYIGSKVSRVIRAIINRVSFEMIGCLSRYRHQKATTTVLISTIQSKISIRMRHSKKLFASVLIDKMTRWSKFELLFKICRKNMRQCT